MRTSQETIGSNVSTSTADTDGKSESEGTLRKILVDKGVESSNFASKDDAQPASGTAAGDQYQTAERFDKLNKPWPLRSSKEREKIAREIFALDKDPVTALQKAMLMPKFFGPKKSNG